MEKASSRKYLKLIEKAKSAVRFAYAPYSKISVGAALYARGGKIYTGANIENSSYGLTMCAERVAVYRAVAEGNTRFRALVLYSKEVDFIMPCGACLQVIGEFSPETVIFTLGPQDQFKMYPLAALLPQPFRLQPRHR